MTEHRTSPIIGIYPAGWHLFCSKATRFLVLLNPVVKDLRLTILSMLAKQLPKREKRLFIEVWVVPEGGSKLSLDLYTAF